MFDSKIFSHNIKALRERFGLQRQAFADLCGISIYTLRSYQSGEIEPSMKTLLKICNNCCITPNVLFEGIYTTPTELENIKLIRTTQADFDDEKKAKFEKLHDIFLTCMTQTAPSLVNVDLGTRIKILREDYGLSQKAFASLCNVTVGTLSCIESNQALPGIEVILAACSSLSISPEFLLCSSLKDVQFENEIYFGLTPRQIACLVDAVLLFKTKKF